MVNDSFVGRTMKTIITCPRASRRESGRRAGAKIGQIGDGKIFVINLPGCISVGTDGRGGEAVG
jgi:nitrogen regulatory protein PII